MAIEEFIDGQRRPKPVILLLDTSGSMSCEGRIDQLNRGVRGLLADLAKIRAMSVEMYVAIIEFGGDTARLAVDYSSLKDIKWKDLEAHGCTPLGSALELAKNIIEDKSKLKPNSYRPTVILMSDGVPTDDYEDAMRAFTQEGRSAKCDRFVAAVQGADKSVLSLFVNDSKTHMFEANNAEDILEFMMFMSTSICRSSTSSNPNATPVKDLQTQVKEEFADTDIPDDWGNSDFDMFGDLFKN